MALLPDNPLSESQSERRLDSWKEIAAYLGRTERTVRRWEEREGLPVHRLVHEKRGSVYAFERELDQWQASRTETIPEVERLAPDEETVTSEISRVSPPLIAKRLTLWVVVVGLVLAAVSLVPWRFPNHPAIASIAVLPLENVSGNPADEWFSDGMTEMLITELTRIRLLRVVGSSFVMPYKGSNKPLKQIRADLGVDGLLEGSALHIGNEVQINVRLVDASTGVQLWAGDYRRSLDDVLTLHKEVARVITRSIGNVLAVTDVKKRQDPRPTNPIAMERYLRGRYSANRRDLQRSIDLAREAIRIDPEFAAAYILLGDSLIIQADSSQVVHREIVGEATTALEHALQLDPDDAAAISDLGYIAFLVHHYWEHGEASLRRGYEMNPGTGCAYGFFLAAKGNFRQSVEACSEAVKWDPANPGEHTNLALIYHFARRYTESVDSFRKALALDPSSIYPHYYLPYTSLQAGQPDQAFEEWVT